MQTHKRIPIIKSHFFAREKLVPEKFGLFLQHLDESREPVVRFPINIDVDAVVRESEKPLVDSASWGYVHNRAGEEKLTFGIFKKCTPLVVNYLDAEDVEASGFTVESNPISMRWFRLTSTPPA